MSKITYITIGTLGVVEKGMEKKITNRTSTHLQYKSSYLRQSLSYRKECQSREKISCNASGLEFEPGSKRCKTGSAKEILLSRYEDQMLLYKPLAW